MVHGTMTKEEIEMIDQVEPAETSMDDMGRRGQILWIRGLTRLQHQVGRAHHFTNCVYLYNIYGRLYACL